MPWDHHELHEGVPTLRLRAGDWAEVRSKEEILRTLDKNARLGELPFMPQMFQYCGQRFRVFKRAHKTCDTITETGGRRLSNSVHLDHRCDGEAYDGCQAACLIFWKEAWLKPISGLGRSPDSSGADQCQPAHQPGCSEENVWRATRTGSQRGDCEQSYVCQATQLLRFTTPLPWWKMGQYIEDYTSRNITMGRLLRGLVYANYYNLSRAGIGVGPLLRWLYAVFQSIYGGVPYPRWGGKIPADQRTPARLLNLQPGELVRVKSYKDILLTVNVKNRNRGLFFDAEHVPYCGGIYRVRSRVNKYIDEKTGRLKILNNEAVILEGVWCQARYSNCRMFCPRSIYPWWREIWLERVGEGPQDP